MHACSSSWPPTPPARLCPRAHLLLGRSVLPRVSPALAAAEGHQSTGPSHPSWRVGRKVGKAPSSLMSVGRLSQGGQWPMCARPVPRLLWCAPSSERGAVQHRGSKSWRWRECARAQVQHGGRGSLALLAYHEHITTYHHISEIIYHGAYTYISCTYHVCMKGAYRSISG